MNATLRRHAAPGTVQQTVVLLPVGQLGLLDRLALRVGLALILWGQRGSIAPPPEEVLRLRAARLEAERQRDLLRSSLPPFL